MSRNIITKDENAAQTSYLLCNWYEVIFYLMFLFCTKIQKFKRF